MKKKTGILLTLIVMASVSICAQSVRQIKNSESQSELKTLKVYVQGDSSRLSDFVEDCRHEFENRGIKLQTVPFDSEFTYNIVIAQESSMGGAAAAVIALDKKGLFVASVVRSGRMSGKGALNASAKELSQKLSVLSAQ
jgi:hypothetical protein